MVKKALSTLVAAALSAVLGSGCYVQAPYSYVRVDTPRSESGVVVERPSRAWPAQHPQAPSVPMYGNCIEYAANAAESANPDGHRVAICTCYSGVDPVTYAPDPRTGYTCQIGVR